MHQNGYIEVHGGPIYYEVAGDGTPFVMIHAGVADSGTTNLPPLPTAIGLFAMISAALAKACRMTASTAFMGTLSPSSRHCRWRGRSF